MQTHVFNLAKRAWAAHRFEIDPSDLLDVTMWASGDKGDPAFSVSGDTLVMVMVTYLEGKDRATKKITLTFRELDAAVSDHARVLMSDVNGGE